MVGFAYPVKFLNIITGGDDYESGPFVATIPAGETSLAFNISIIDDNIFEQNEFFTLTIDSSSLPTRVSMQRNCLLVVTIVDDDGKLCAKLNSLLVKIANLIK